MRNSNKKSRFLGQFKKGLQTCTKKGLQTCTNRDLQTCSLTPAALEENHHRDQGILKRTLWETSLTLSISFRLLYSWTSQLMPTMPTIHALRWNNLRKFSSIQPNMRFSIYLWNLIRQNLKIWEIYSHRKAPFSMKAFSFSSLSGIPFTTIKSTLFSEAWEFPTNAQSIFSMFS